MSLQGSNAQIEYRIDSAELVCAGSWTIESVAWAEQQFSTLQNQLAEAISINGEGMEKIDSAGGMFLHQLLKKIKQQGKRVNRAKLGEKCRSMLELIESQPDLDEKLVKRKLPNWLYLIGKWGVEKIIECLNFIAFIGHFVLKIFACFKHPNQITWRSILVVIDETGYQALAIVALLTFLVGIVVTYQIALQLSEYGANIYIVDLTGMIIFREFGPLITAIIAAGRTSTAFTAQIGTMKVNEEIDALKTMGVSPFVRIVLPKVIGLLIALPLLAVWADIFGVLGAMLMAKIKLGVNYLAFLDRFQHQIAVRQFIVGLVKVPVFAILIALVGSYQGFQVVRSADSVGRKTTKSAVQSIFLIIIADALFSVIFSMRGI